MAQRWSVRLLVFLTDIFDCIHWHRPPPYHSKTESDYVQHSVIILLDVKVIQEDEALAAIIMENHLFLHKLNLQQVLIGLRHLIQYQKSDLNLKGTKSDLCLHLYL